MIYVVSGFVRSGTSMMMQCLAAGGLKSAFNPQRESLNDHGDENYQPNRGGFYEVAWREYGTPGWPLQYQGSLVKIFFWGLDGMSVNQEGYRIVLMTRDHEEIRQSYEAAFGVPLTVPPDLDKRLDGARVRMFNRRDVHSVNMLDYRFVVDSPLKAFDSLRWPIDPHQAAAQVDPSQCRFRRELLVEGI
ncbi:MAG TPA: hypothetical protein VHC22_32535 [Pirellulales bacterium]|nr:hypothetical protein [Pirellulales bacterium]